MNNYKGVIIEESLINKNILKKVKIISTKVESVTPKHQTPWLKIWTLYTIEIPFNQVDEIANKLSEIIIDNPSSWYVDFNNKETFYVIYPNKIFKWRKGDIDIIKKCKKYGISLGIPSYQVNFSTE